MIPSDTPLLLVITAAGSSTRMGTGVKKEYMTVNGKTVLSTALEAFLNCASFSAAVITVPSGKTAEAQSAVFSNQAIQPLLNRNNTRLIFTEGSTTRQKSVFNALKKLKESLTEKELSSSVVLIHDGARPFVTPEIITGTIEAALSYGGAAPVIPATDTQKIIAADGTITTHLQRSSIGCIQTPQGFDFNTLYECHQLASEQDKEYTDDTEIFDAFRKNKSMCVHVVKGSIQNKKITYREDIAGKGTDAGRGSSMLRIGFGTDLHRLVAGRKMFLGGVNIPCDKGELGHSDGDVLLHAISDALLGAAGMGDIGSYFPPEDPQWKDADSAVLLSRIWDDVTKAGWSLQNLDCVVETEAPKFLPWRDKVIDSIASILKTERCRIFVKAKTNEKLDSVGAGEAIKAYCTCLLTQEVQG